MEVSGVRQGLGGEANSGPCPAPNPEVASPDRQGLEEDSYTDVALYETGMATSPSFNDRQGIVALILRKEKEVDVML